MKVAHMYVYINIVYIYVRDNPLFVKKYLFFKNEESA